jgi:hypothetical protein
MKPIFKKKIGLIETNFSKLHGKDVICEKPRREKSAYTHVASPLLQNRREF